MICPEQPAFPIIDERGVWSNNRVVPGHYTIHVELTGFAPVNMLAKFPGTRVVRMGPDLENLEMGVIVSGDGIVLEAEPVHLPDVINPSPETNKKR